MEQLQAFNEFLQAERLAVPGERLLLAVSGGLDSVVLCDLFSQSGYDFVLAHANFQLRGEESLRDEQFVRDLAVKYDKPVLVRAFDTAAYAAARKLSIQVAARELRYEWFSEILAADDALRRLATAHHLDDNIETLLMNLFKGTGIAGLRGILPRQGNIIRPLLWASKEDLRHFARLNRLAWVEDSSNSSDKYTRNYFRHRIIPLVQQVYPEAMSNLGDNIRRFREIEILYDASITRMKKQLLHPRGREVHVPILRLKRSEPLAAIVYELVKPFGFSSQQVPAVIALLDSGSGRYICSSSHRILVNRAWLVISPLEDKGTGYILIESPEQKTVYGDRTLHIRSMTITDPMSLIAQTAAAGGGRKARQPENSVWLDASEISFPLLLRKWRAGDYFYPLGMRKKKKLARFFIDSKLSLANKEKIWVLEMNKKIVWVIGMRIDDRFRITPETRQALKIESGLHELI